MPVRRKVSDPGSAAGSPHSRACAEYRVGLRRPLDGVVGRADARHHAPARIRPNDHANDGGGCLDACRHHRRPVHAPGGAFAAAPALHDQAALDLLVEAARPRPSDVSLDVACGPGSVVRRLCAARAPGRWASTPRRRCWRRRAELAAQRALANVAWHQGDVYALPFADGAFDIVSCRFAFHHLEEPARAFAEMVRVCRPGGRIVLCDAVASDDPAKAAAFNAMERLRDPSTVEFRTLGFLRGLFATPGCRSRRRGSTACRWSGSA